MQQTADAGAAAGVEHAAGHVDDLFPELPPRPPFADAGGAMVHHVGPAHRAAERIGVVQVCIGQFGADPLEERRVARRADEGADLLAAHDEPFRDMTAQHSGRPGDDVKFHERRGLLHPYEKRLTISGTFCPPKPKLLLRAWRTVLSRAALGT